MLVYQHLAGSPDHECYVDSCETIAGAPDGRVVVRGPALASFARGAGEAVVTVEESVLLAAADAIRAGTAA